MKKLKFYLTRPELFKFFTEEELEKEYPYWVGGEYNMWAFRRMEGEAFSYAETILPQLKAQRGGGRDYIVCVGKNYSWMGSWSSLKSSRDRSGQFRPVLEIIGLSCFEYWAYSGDSWENLKFERATRARAEELLGMEIGKKVRAIGVKEGFFPQESSIN